MKKSAQGPGAEDPLGEAQYGVAEAQLPLGPSPLIKGRGIASRLPSRLSKIHIEAEPCPEDPPPRLKTEVTAEKARTIITRQKSPDIPFEQSINPYRGCEHGCVYCYARPSHGYMDLSPGLDFETKLFYKPEAAQLLEAELARPGYRCKPIAMGTNTDPYQPLERRLGVTRSIIEVLLRTHHPFTILTKGAAILRDLDLLVEAAEQGLCSAAVSMTTLDDELKRTLEPRAASGAARLAVIRALTGAGVPLGVLLAPVIPGINDSEMEDLLEACAAAGARRAGYVLLRLPYEVEPLFTDWLAGAFPQRAQKVMNLIRSCHGGRCCSGRGARHSGTGPLAELLGNRFRVACRRLGLNTESRTPLDCSRFTPPRPASGSQLGLDF